jgi:hypothetical protein
MSYLRSYGPILSKPPDFGNLVRIFQAAVFALEILVVGGFRDGVCFGFVGYAIAK